MSLQLVKRFAVMATLRFSGNHSLPLGPATEGATDRVARTSLRTSGQLLCTNLVPREPDPNLFECTKRAT